MKAQQSNVVELHAPRPARERRKHDLAGVLHEAANVARIDGCGRIRVLESYGTLPGVVADMGDLMLVFTNIVDNAVQAMHNGGELRIRAWQSTLDRVTVTFTNTGGGLSEDDLPRIFRAFYTTRADSGHLGLGLYLARMFVEQFGGRLSAERDRHGNAVISVELQTVRYTS